MKDDLTINLKQLRNDQHFQLFGEFGDIVSDFGAEALKIEPQFAVWEAQFQKEDAALKKIIRSPLTEEINALDARRDQIYSGLAGSCKIASNHFIPEIKAAARPLQVIFDTYGNVARKPLSEKTSAIINLLQELSGYEDEVKTAGLERWIEELDATNSECYRLVKSRWDEAAQQRGLKMKEARAGVDAAYNVIMERIFALKVVFGDEIYDNFLRRFGVVIDTYNMAMAHRRNKGGNDADVQDNDAETGGSDVDNQPE